MNLPNVVHPTVFAVGKHQMQVVTYFELTHPEATFLVRVLVRQRKWPIKGKATRVYVPWIGDRTDLEQMQAISREAGERLGEMLSVRRR
jgi:hypothetical protein